MNNHKMACILLMALIAGMIYAARHRDELLANGSADSADDETDPSDGLEPEPQPG